MPCNIRVSIRNISRGVAAALRVMASRPVSPARGSSAQLSLASLGMVGPDCAVVKPDRASIPAIRIRASLLAGAIGDAWGGSYEGLVGPLPAPFPNRPRLSDDTLLTVATCEAIVQSGRVDPAV